VLVAQAALDRLAITSDRSEVLSTTVMLPQIGQGAIGLRCRIGEVSTIALVEAINDHDALLAVRAERAFLRRLGGGCDAPVGALAHCRRGHHFHHRDDRES